ncbi:hypothetical protein ACFU6K_38510, partial [Kitasatospora sp. NPDC057512]|uniref:hypothetical protein n=1 Tax=Kitasatospora sp. NPDC057512 TaxID=3346154 RepID=UPI0036C31FBC
MKQGHQGLESQDALTINLPIPWEESSDSNHCIAGWYTSPNPTGPAAAVDSARLDTVPADMRRAALRKPLRSGLTSDNALANAKNHHAGEEPPVFRMREAIAAD